MGFLDDVGDGLEGLYKDGKKQVGRVIDQNAHTVGGMLDFVGLHDAAHTVDAWGDSVADDLGAQVGEKQLGQSDDPKDLVHGDAKALTDTAAHLRKFHDAFQETGSGLQALDSSHWQGQAADAFRAKFEPHPALWLTAADACAAAATALDGFSQTVTWAQGQAKQAIDAYNAAKKAHQQAQDAYNASVDSYNAAAKRWNDAAKSNPDPGPKPTDPGAFHDPSTDQLTHAQDLLRAARAGRDSAADSAASALKTATATAPTAPSFTQRMKLDSMDLAEGGVMGGAHLYGGIFKGAADIVNFGRGLDPMDVYNITHPATYLDHVNQTAAGLVHADMHPIDVVKSLVGSGWGSDPFEAGGKLLTNVAFGALTGGSGEAATAAESVGIDASRSAGENAAKDAAQDAAHPAPAPAAVPANTDPLAVAVDRNVDIDAISHTPVFRDTNGPLYRMANRPPEQAFKEGFAPHDTGKTDLLRYANGGYDSAFVGTSKVPEISAKFLRRFQYEFDAPGGIDVNATLGELSPHPGEQEVVFPGGIRPEFIKGAWEMGPDGSTRMAWHPNPDYVPRAPGAPPPPPPAAPNPAGLPPGWTRAQGS
ncbi:uncharacterized protein YukE [Kitasatospora sp. MAA4]|uniref:putative T7SS-secreted protein n=1 Tax=Kitasatospora sp. MAA4 TaxID=3035093 RepID=UPI00247673F3|nr:hypothetical protein [Kitasatospora sp. MAA4]MDH6133294.1 uncharacterized protein YukE [Kitasatospora sp. MAA4]